MKQPPILSTGTKHVIVHVIGSKHFLQFRDGPHLVADWVVTEKALRFGVYNSEVDLWIQGKRSWNWIDCVAKAIRARRSR